MMKKLFFNFISTMLALMLIGCGDLQKKPMSYEDVRALSQQSLDSKVTALFENTTPLLTDLLYWIDDPGGTPASEKIYWGTLLDDTKGNGDVVNVWSADKIHDGLALKLTITDIDDTPVDSETSAPISSNWAYDHVAASDPHTGYCLESAFGDTVGDGLLKSGTNLVLDLTDPHTWTGTQTLPDATITKRTSAPGSPVAGTIYYADCSTWDPASLGIGKAYYVIYDGSNYIALFDEDGDWYVSSIETPTLEEDELNDEAGDRLLTAVELKNKIISNAGFGADSHFDCPAFSEGWNVIFIIEDAYQMDIHPNDSQNWYFNGTVLAADKMISNDDDTVGESIAIFSTETAVYCESKYPNWEVVAEP